MAENKLSVKIEVDSSELDALEARVDALLPKLREMAELGAKLAESFRHIGPRLTEQRVIPLADLKVTCAGGNKSVTDRTI